MPPAHEVFGDELIELLPRLRRFARALSGDPHDADDLVQIALERALSKSHQLRAGAPLAGWMFGIVRNAWIDESRSRGRRKRLFAPEERVVEVADPAAGNQAESLMVQSAVAGLPEEQREVIGLVLIEGLSYREAAQILAIPVGTVTSRLARAREALQAQLGDAGGGI
ncbi:MAG TPA: RNA polymerase sigma factor [Steroidobacteraceae bacterium]|nr:RNA polymerase sigma factor [Steroidobacteraceae bacterium]